MYTEEQFISLEEEERGLTDEVIAIIILTLSTVHIDLEKELRNFYQKYGKDGVVTYAEARKWVSEKDHRRRLAALLSVSTLLFADALPKVKRELESMLKSVIGKETGLFDVEIDIDKILTMTWGEDDLNWLKRLEQDFDIWTVRINADLKTSMLQRKNLDDVLKLLDKRFDSIYYVVETLGLSESTAIGSMARQKIFAELGISKYQFYTKVDERRCETCGAMHGLIFPISAYEVGVTASPLHPRCRCWEVPIWD